MSEIETINDQMVCMRGDGMIMIGMLKHEMIEEDALRLAAWLVAITCNKERFDEIYKAVIST